MSPQTQSIRTSSRGQKEDYEDWVSIAMDILHSKQTRGDVHTMIKAGAEDPVRTTANILLLILHKLDNTTRSAGQEVDDAIKLLALSEMVNQVAEIAEALGAFTIDEDHQSLALSIAVQDYVKGEVSAGRINPVKLQAQIATSVGKMPPEERMAMEKSIQKIAQLSKAYAARKQGGAQNGDASASA